MPETTPLIKAASNLRVGAGFDVYERKRSQSILRDKSCTLRPWLKTMIVISDYTLVLKEDFGVFVESSENSHICPVCRGTLRYRDSRPRIRKKEGGTKEQLMIRRFRCQNCHAYHNELPDCLVPYKHYEAEVIAGVLDEVILPEDLDSEDYPSFSTMLRWLQWFRENLQRMEGYLRTVGYQILNLGEDYLFTADSLLDKIRNRYQNWLELLLRLIYNSGGFLVPVRW